MANPKLRVAVVFGGRSSEHAVSCVSAASVLANLDPDRFEILPVGITPDGAWVLGPAEPKELEIRERRMPTVSSGTALTLPADPTSAGLVVLDRGREGEVLAGVVGREVECGVLEFPDGHLEASLPAEIRLVNAPVDWYDFDSKYIDDVCELDIPAKLDDAVTERLRAMAIKAFQAMDCQGLAR